MREPSSQKTKFQLLAEITALFASIVGVLAFFTVKPIPKLTFVFSTISEGEVGYNEELYYAIGEYEQRSCYIAPSLANWSGLEEHDGLAVYVDLKISADSNRSNVEAHMSDGCLLKLGNLASAASSYLFQDESQFFEHRIGVEVPAQTEKPDSYPYLPELILPNASAHNAQVDHCEAYCYSLSGLVRVKRLSESEGIASIIFEPINAYQNSYLMRRFECRLLVERWGAECFAPIYCSLW